MLPAALSHIDCWIFDLDNTLYHPSARMFDLIDDRIGAYVAERLGVDRGEAHRIQKSYFRDHGTTMAGMMAAHDIDPHAYLAFVHDVPMDRLSPAPELAARISSLPGRKLVYTNADGPYATRVLKARGLGGVFESVFDICATAFVPKPDPASYTLLCDQLGVAPKSAFFADDMVRNLVPAKKIGMTTLWINNGSELGNSGHHPEAADFEAADLQDWLAFDWEDS